MLEELYKAAPQSCAVFGRIRLGKTALLQKFCEFKRHIYISGSSALPEECLRNMSEAVSRYTGETENLEDIQDLFDAIKEHCVKKTVVILDHYSELLAVFPDLYNHVNRFVSRDIRETRVLLIACDTDESMFGRFVNQIEVRPMNYLECAGFHPDYTPIQNLQAYGIVGGTPEYQHIIKGDPVESLKDCFLDPVSSLSMEAESMVNSEISVKGDSIKILHAMAAGADSLRSISSKAGLPPSVCTRAIGEMENKGLVIRDQSASVQRNWVCSFDSNVLKFYYTVVVSARMLPDFYSKDKAYLKAKSMMPAYMEGTFKTVCVEYLRMRWSATSIERIRSNSSSVNSDIDYQAEVKNESGRKRAAFLVCRLSGEPFGVPDLNRLMYRSKALKAKDKGCFMLFSGCGFTDELKAAAASDSEVVLVSLEDVYKPLPAPETKEART